MYLIDYSNMLCQLILTFMSFILLTFWNTRYVVWQTTMKVLFWNVVLIWAGCIVKKKKNISTGRRKLYRDKKGPVLLHGIAFL